MTDHQADRPAGEPSGLDVDDIRRVLEALDASDWDEALITVGDVRIAVARNGGVLPGAAQAPASPGGPVAPTAAPVVAAAPSAAQSAPLIPAPAADADGPAPAGVVVEAPSIGVFWRAPEPGASPFVEVGTQVAVGDTLGIVEVMKLMSHVDAPVAGTVIDIHADNAQSVEHGASLFTISPEGG